MRSLRDRTLFARFLVLLLALGLVAAACGGDDDDDDDGAAGGETTTTEEEDGGGQEGGEFSLYIGQDPSSLVPTNANDSESSQIVQTIFTGLVDYDIETTEPYNVIAESIESDDNVNWTIKIRDDFTFHNGEPVTAQSFVDAWNFAANAGNAQANNYFFERFEGYDEIQCGGDGSTDEETGECITPPTETELSGLSAPDDTTIEVELKGPFSQFPIMLGYNAFYPMPEVAFEDIEAFNEEPIGNGPYMMDGPWDHDVAVNVVRYEDYAGDNTGFADAVEFRIYADLETGYNDLLAGSLDVQDSVPPEQLQAAKTEFGDRFIERPSSSFTYIGFPTYDPKFEDPKIRQAFSLAIDRETIIEEIFFGTLTPARSVVSPVVAGSREDACEFCEYDPDRAAELLEEAGGWEGTLNLYFNSGAGHDQWMEAVANQLRQNLGIEDIQFQSLEFAEYLDKLDAQDVDGPYRLGWGMDYPSPQNYLEPLYTTQAHAPNGSNATFYTNPEFDELIEEGNAADSIEEGIDKYQEAEDLLLQDMPVIPMWFGRVQGAHSENVSNVQIDAFARVRVTEVVVNS